MSCAYFDIDDHSKVDCYAKSVICGRLSVSDCILCICRHLLASIYCHLDYLRDILPPSHRFRSIPLFMAPSEDLVEAACFKYPREATSHTPRLTGILPHVTLLAKMDIVVKKQEGAVDEFLAGVRKELDERNNWRRVQYSTVDAIF